MYGQFYQFTYQQAINQYDQIELWSKVLGRNVDLGHRICNPCRIDNNPRCFLRKWNGLVLLTDFAFPQYNKYTAVHAYADIHNVSLNRAATLLLNGRICSIKAEEKKAFKENTKTNIYFDSYTYNNTASFLPQDRDYWSARGITREQLERHNVYSVWRYSVNGYTFYPNDLCYAYVLDSGNIKIYQPNSINHKWTSNTTVTDIWHSSNFPPSNIAILTKSLKDLMILENLYPDIDIISFQNEGVMPDLQVFNLYDYIYIFYDNDKTGINQSKKVRKQLSSVTNCESIFIPTHFNCKDIDELYIRYGRDMCKEVMNVLLQTTEETIHLKLVPSLVYL